MSAQSEYCRADLYHHVEGAINNLRELVIDRCPGYDCYDQDYKKALNDAYRLLLEIRSII